MARTAAQQGDSPHTADSGQHQPPQERQPSAPAVVLTPEGQRRLAAKAAWLATERIPRFAHSYLDDPDQDGWASAEYGHDVNELAFLTRTLQRAITTDQLAPEHPGIVELGDEVAVEFANGYTQRFLMASPIEAPLDDLNISVESPLGQALVGRRVGEQVEVDAPDGRFRCRILTTGRHQPAASRPKTSGSWVTKEGWVVFVRYPPGKIRYEGDRPVALLSVRLAPWFRLVDLPLGLPTTSARTSRGTWALYPIGAEAVVVHPDGAVSGPAAEVATEVGRLATRDRQGDLDRQAAWTIQRLLTGDDPARAGFGRLGARTWSIPAKAYWLSGPDNHHGQPAAGRPDHPEPSHGVEPATGDPATPVASPPGPASNQIAGNHRPQRNLHRPRHGHPVRFKQRLGARTSQGGNANHEDHGRL